MVWSEDLAAAGVEGRAGFTPGWSRVALRQDEA
jgi:hypothetical protein